MNIMLVNDGKPNKLIVSYSVPRHAAPSRRHSGRNGIEYEIRTICLFEGTIYL
ncbi:MAG TPA: hypothetical protein VJ455_04820 [Ignavibacteria bacterium]|nr:hypothetical protein [Ignavibacteria bacterium]